MDAKKMQLCQLMLPHGADYQMYAEQDEKKMPPCQLMLPHRANCQMHAGQSQNWETACATNSKRARNSFCNYRDAIFEQFDPLVATP